MSFLGLFGKSRVEDVDIPEFQNDPIFSDLQSFLSGYGKNILTGDIPDYYKSIGESGSLEFENVLKNVNRDISRGVAESAAISGRARGGAVPAVTSRAIADSSANLRYQDLLNANEGKKFLFSGGSNMLGSTRNAALNNQGQVNQYALNKAKTEIGQKSYLDNYDMTTSKMEGELIMQILNTIAGAVAGGMTGGIGGAGVGAVGGIEGLADTGALDKLFE